MKNYILTGGFIFLAMIPILVQAATVDELMKPSPMRNALLAQHEATLKKDANDLIALRELGIILHMQIVESEEKDEELIELAHDLLKRAYLQNKIHALTMAYYGSITTMMTMTTPWPMSKLKFVKSGARKMDKAIKMSPDNVDVRMLRGTNSLNLPKFLKRGRYAILDFQHVLLLTPSADSEEKAELHRKISAGYLLLDDAKNAEKHRKLAQILEEK